MLEAGQMLENGERLWKTFQKFQDIGGRVDYVENGWWIFKKKKYVLSIKEYSVDIEHVMWYEDLTIAHINYLIEIYGKRG